MITIKNTQHKIAINKEQISQDVKHLLAFLRYQDFDIGIWFTTDKTIRLYNQNYRHKDKPTDILSFPYHTNLVAGKRIKVSNPEDKNLGDIIISPAYIQKQLELLTTPFEQRLRVIIVHGICHLLGYDHIEDHDYRRMRAKEAYLLKQLASSDKLKA